MALVLPLRNDVPVFDFQIELDGQTYGLEFRWNFRSEAWALSLFDVDEQPIALNLGVVADFPIGRRLQSDRMPAGVLVFKDTTGRGLAPGFADLGTRVQLVYLAITD